MSHIVTEVAGDGSLAQLVAINASIHRNLSLLPQAVLIKHPAMTHLAIYLGIAVFLMTEEDKFR